MTSQLNANLLKLFTPRPPVDYLPPLDRNPAIVRQPLVTGLAEVLDRCKGHDEGFVPTDSIEERKRKKILDKQNKAKEKLEAALNAWDPNGDESLTSDPYKTLFVGRLSYSTTEKYLRREFERYGPIVSVRIIHDTTSPTSQPRGYAFIEFERERDLTAAYKDADGIKLDGRRIVVDVERGRTVKGWKPRRLGGGLGGTRIGGADVNQRHSGRESSSTGAGGGSSSSYYSSSSHSRRDDGHRGSSSYDSDRRHSSSYGGGAPDRGGYDGGGRSGRGADDYGASSRRRSRSPRRDDRRY